jgi:3-hydroxyisobutyrate dehydrogenase
MNKIGFIGLGNMGGPMAQNLLKAGHKLKVFDLSASAVATLKELGAESANSAAECAQGVDTLITMLPSSPHVKEVYLGSAGGVIQAAKPGTFLIDCSTIAPATAREVAAAAQKAGFEMIDAPVSGGVGGAKGGTLTFIVGGTGAAFEKSKPILSAMGKNIFHAGPAGNGQVAKICNNMLLAIHMIGTSEALNLGVQNGIDAKVLSEIMSKSSGRNWSLEVYNPWPGVAEGVPSSRGYEGGFAVDLMTKDLGLALEAALATKSQVPLGQMATDLYKNHSKAGSGRLDFSSILNFFRGQK